MVSRERQSRRNVPSQAVALHYDAARDKTPKVVAKGRGGIADRIRELAVEHGIPIRQDDALVELLAQVDLDREIPQELYAAVAEILSWIYRANEAMKQEFFEHET